jgi:hypothetical protein
MPAPSPSGRSRVRSGAMAKKHNKGSRGAFIAWAVDLACFFLEAQDNAHDERNREMHLWDRKHSE